MIYVLHRQRTFFIYCSYHLVYIVFVPSAPVVCSRELDPRWLISHRGVMSQTGLLLFDVTLDY